MATDIYRPAHNGVAVNERFPVLLQRTPYDKTKAQKNAEYLTQHGYVVAVQDSRGRYKSEGKFLKVQPIDATDGYDVVEWLGETGVFEWRSGHVGHVVRRTSRGGRCATPPTLPEDNRGQHGRHVERMGPWRAISRHV